MPNDNEPEPFRTLKLSEHMAYLVASACLTEIEFVKKVPIGFNHMTESTRQEWLSALRDVIKELDVPMAGPTN